MNKNIRFIMLEVSEEVNNVEGYKNYQSVQIIYPSIKYPCLNIEEIKSRVGNSLRLEEKKNLYLQSLLMLIQNMQFPSPVNDTGVTAFVSLIFNCFPLSTIESL